mmetsp:Transcript_7956/g.18282  ORF Transcript_7956/g.18282 Transcript_7956/m.18282 type:complete len:531 (+) Transcript_7956:232-1824(+)
MAIMMSTVIIVLSGATHALAFQSPPIHSSRVVAHCGGVCNRWRGRAVTVPKTRPDDDDDDADDESDESEFIRADDLVDFDSIDGRGKRFEVGEYGVICSKEPDWEDYEPAADPLSVDEFETWIKRNSLREKKLESKKRWSRMFPWVPWVSRLIFPRRQEYTSSGDTTLSSGRLKAQSDFYQAPTPTSTPRFLRGFISTPNSLRNTIIALNICAYAYTIATAVYYLPGFNRVLSRSVAGNSLSAAALDSSVPRFTPKDIVLRALGFVGGGAGIVISSGRGGFAHGRGPIAAHSLGPFFLDNVHQPYPLSHVQRHRYISSSFLHGSLVHIVMNMRALVSLPSWLENGIGKGVYLASYISGVISGNVASTLVNVGNVSAASTLCLGCSGGICGLYGLMMASLMKMGNPDAAWYVLKSMIWLVMFGLIIPGISNAGHVGGFIGGWLVGYLFGPGYERSYTLGRSKSDTASWDFRRAMGAGVYPSQDRAFFPINYFWYAAAVILIARPELRYIPLALARSIIEPGALSGCRSLLT